MDLLGHSIDPVNSFRLVPFFERIDRKSLNTDGVIAKPIPLQKKVRN